MFITGKRPEFESLVNTEGIQTFWACDFETTVFESLVNTEGIQTLPSRGEL